MLIVVIDTNVLFQCPPLGQLDWETLDSNGVTVVIPEAVLPEIDNAKAAGNSRRAAKAREISAIFGRALDAQVEGLPLKPGSASRWIFGSGELATHDKLNIEVADHRIIAEALALGRNNPNVLFFSGDILARLLAQRVGLQVKALPDDWRLPPEPDARDKRVRDLEQRVKALESEEPTVGVELHEADSAVASISHAGRYLRMPTKTELDELMNAVRRRYPMGEKPDDDASRLSTALLGGSFDVPSNHEYDQYRLVTYPEWLAKTQKLLQLFPSLWSLRERIKTVRLVLQNNGHVPADGVIFEYEVFGDVQLMPVDDKLREQLLSAPLSFPAPPKAPAIRLIHPMDQLDSYSVPRDIFGGSSIPALRGQPDRYSFYPRDCPDKPVKRHSFECSELRHGTIVDFDVHLLLPASLKSEGTLVCRATARNMRKEFQQVFKIEHSATEVDSMTRLRELVNPPQTLLVANE